MHASTAKLIGEVPVHGTAQPDANIDRGVSPENQARALTIIQEAIGNTDIRYGGWEGLSSSDTHP